MEEPNTYEHQPKEEQQNDVVIFNEQAENEMSSEKENSIIIEKENDYLTIDKIPSQISNDHLKDLSN